VRLGDGVGEHRLDHRGGERRAAPGHAEARGPGTAIRGRVLTVIILLLLLLRPLEVFSRGLRDGGQGLPGGGHVGRRGVRGPHGGGQLPAQPREEPAAGVVGPIPLDVLWQRDRGHGAGAVGLALARRPVGSETDGIVVGGAHEGNHVPGRNAVVRAQEERVVRAPRRLLLAHPEPPVCRGQRSHERHDCVRLDKAGQLRGDVRAAAQGAETPGLRRPGARPAECLEEPCLGAPRLHSARAHAPPERAEAKELRV